MLKNNLLLETENEKRLETAQGDAEFAIEQPKKEEKINKQTQNRKKNLLEVLDIIGERGYLKKGEREKIQTALENKDVMRLATMEVVMMTSMMFTDLESSIISALAIAAVSGWPLAVLVFSTLTAVNTVLANREAHYLGKGLPEDLHKKLKKTCMIPQVGKYMPAVYLFKNYPEVLKLLYVYEKIRKIHKKKNAIENKDSLEYKNAEVKELKKLERVMFWFEWRKLKVRAVGAFVKKISLRVKNTIASWGKPKESPNTASGFDPAYAMV